MHSLNSKGKFRRSISNYEMIRTGFGRGQLPSTFAPSRGSLHPACVAVKCPDHRMPRAWHAAQGLGALLRVPGLQAPVSLAGLLQQPLPPPLRLAVLSGLVLVFAPALVPASASVSHPPC